MKASIHHLPETKRAAPVAIALLLVHCGARTTLPGGGQGGAPPGGPPLHDGGSAHDGGDASSPPDASLPDGGSEKSCGDTQSSPHDCGVCGRDCQGGACVNGVCQPVLLANGESLPHTLAIDDKKVYWVNYTDVDYGMPPASLVVRSLPKAGGTPTTLATMSPGQPTSLHRDGQYLYFYRSIEFGFMGQSYVGSIMRLCADGSCPLVNLSGDVENYPFQIGLDATRIYYPSGLGISSMAKGGGGPADVLYASGSFIRLAVDDAYLYGIVLPDSAYPGFDVSLLRGDKTAPTVPPTTLLTGLYGLSDVLVDATDVFVSDLGAVHRLPKSGAGALVPVTITSPGVVPGLLAGDKDRVYWLQYASPNGSTPATLHWARKDGGGSGTMTLASDATYGVELAVDDTCVYWATTLAQLTPPTPAVGGIMKVVKPL